MSVFDGSTMRDDIVSRLLGGEEDLETSRYLDRLVELSMVEEAEHQFLIDPFDRSVALVFQMFQNSDLDPWDVDLSIFLELFNQRINDSENIDLPTCGRLVRMAWTILRGQASTLLERQERSLIEEEVEDTWDFEDTWESEFSDEDYNFSVGVLTGAASEVLPSMFEGRIHRDEGRPVTLGELLMGLQAAGRLSEEQKMREQIAKERREANEKARARFGGSLHVENLEDDLKRTWDALRSRTLDDMQTTNLSDIVEVLKSNSIESGLSSKEAESEAQVTALVSSLFLTHRGYAEVSQDLDGQIKLKNLHLEEDDFSVLTNRINPKVSIHEGAVINE
jgi:chromatin segregation and condensation protein Rec8/ScpA/Scc1 (kleisin family)|tara:strand:+ start:9302 stop:10309 length:1008 start_codon:yes stop_codon:yes gene_type:complete